MEITAQEHGHFLALYQMAIADKEWIGSDTWGFFNSKVEQLSLIRSKTNRDKNVIVILTDGYMYYQPNKIDFSNNSSNYITTALINSKYKLKTPDFNQIIKSKQIKIEPLLNKNFSNLKVLVLGLNPEKGNPYEQQILETLWKNWLLSMKIPENNIRILQTDLPANLGNTIINFIEN